MLALKVRWPGGGFSLAVLLSLVNAACLNYRPKLQPMPEDAGTIPFAERWTAKAGRGASGTVAILDSVMFVGDADRRVYAIDLTTGETRWSRRLAGSVFGGVVQSGDTLYAATDRPNSRVVALRAADGEILWEHHAGKPSAPITVADGRILVPTFDGRLVGLDARTGGVVWERRLGSSRAAAVRSGADTTVFATTDSIFCLRTGDGKVVHRTASPGAVLGGWRRFGELLVAGTADSLLIGLRPRDLAIVWRVALDAAILESPAVHGDTAYVVSRSGTLYQIELGPAPRPQARVLAELHWPVTAPPVQFRQWVLVAGADGVIRAIGANGAEDWRLIMWQPVRMAPVVLEDGIVAIGGIGDFSRYQQQ
jgi:outer membrane protein assembly factor BamB